MNWQEIESNLQAQPLPRGRSKDDFWAEFRSRTESLPRDQRVAEPIGFVRWSVLAAAAVAILAGVAVLMPKTPTTAMQVASTEVKSVDVVASHAGVIIMTAEADDAGSGGTVLWIADLDLSATEGNN